MFLLSPGRAAEKLIFGRTCGDLDGPLAAPSITQVLRGHVEV